MEKIKGIIVNGIPLPRLISEGSLQVHIAIEVARGGLDDFVPITQCGLVFGEGGREVLRGYHIAMSYEDLTAVIKGLGKGERLCRRCGSLGRFIDVTLNEAAAMRALKAQLDAARKVAEVAESERQVARQAFILGYMAALRKELTALGLDAEYVDFDPLGMHEHLILTSAGIRFRIVPDEWLGEPLD